MSASPKPSGNPKPASSKSIDLMIWSALGGSPALLFGEECASVATWTFLVLLLRTVLYFTYAEPFIPNGLVYALPILIQVCSQFIPIFKSSFPILPVRIAECFLGKVSPSRILIILPAHLLGAIFGAVAFKTVLPFLPNQILRPVVFPSAHWASTLLLEAGLSFAYCMLLLVLPYILDVNRISSKLVNLPLLPLLLSASTLNPSLVYGLWYLHHCSSFFSLQALPLERLAGPILGGMAAGLVCNVYFPDDPRSWARSQAKP